MPRKFSEKQRVLLVVPSEVERAGLRLMIEAEGADDVIAEAANGQAALALAEKLEPEVAIIDAALADVPALGLVHFLSARCPGTQALFYTATCTKDWACAALREGVRAFVLKSKAGTHLGPALRALSDRRPYWIDAVDDETFDQLLQQGVRPTPSSLTSRELQVLEMAAQDKSSKEIARTLGLSFRTVEQHRTQLRRRLGIRNQADLVRYVLSEGTAG
jgi:two-component system, NarL family, nitrate/nitrite response regulator NarL